MGPQSHLLGIQLPCPVHGAVWPASACGVWRCSPWPQSWGLDVPSYPSCKPSLGRPRGLLGVWLQGIPEEGPRDCQSCVLPPVIPCICFLELSKSQNDMTSDKQLLATGPRQCASRTERRSQSDTAINVTSRVFPQATGRHESYS